MTKAESDAAQAMHRTRDPFSPFSLQPWAATLPWKLALVFDPPTTPAGSNAGWQTITQLRNAFAAIRVFDDAPVCAPFFVLQTSVPSGGFQFTAVEIGFGGYVPTGAIQYWSGADKNHFSVTPPREADLVNFVSRTTAWVSAEPDFGFGEALSRVDGMCAAPQEGNRLIDSVIALEAILLPGYRNRDKSVRLAKRGSKLLGTSPSEIATIASDLAAIYKKRNDIVHGSLPPAANPTANAAVDLSRRVIRAFVTSALPPDHLGFATSLG
jgi:hypothetical protein